MIKVHNNFIEFIQPDGENIKVLKKDIPELISVLAQIHFDFTKGTMIQIMDQQGKLMYTVLDNKKFEEEKTQVEKNIELLMAETNAKPM